MKEAIIEVSEQAVIARLRRRLAREFQRFSKARNPVCTEPHYWVIDAHNNAVDGFYRENLEEYARERGVLKDFERMAV